MLNQDYPNSAQPDSLIGIHKKSPKFQLNPSFTMKILENCLTSHLAQGDKKASLEKMIIYSIIIRTENTPRNFLKTDYIITREIRRYSYSILALQYMELGRINHCSTLDQRPSHTVEEIGFKLCFDIIPRRTHA